MILPYYYKIRNVNDDTYYFGSRHKNKFPARSDLLKYYNTSSKYVKAIGIENFIIEEIIEFENHNDAFSYEQIQIRNNKRDPLLLNRHYKNPETLSKSYFGSTKGFKRPGVSLALKGIPKSFDTRKKMSESQKMRGGNGPSRHSEETKRKISESCKGHRPGIWTEESRKRLSDLRKSEINIACNICGKVGNGKAAMYRWHFENCRSLK